MEGIIIWIIIIIVFAVVRSKKKPPVNRATTMFENSMKSVVNTQISAPPQPGVPTQVSAPPQTSMPTQTSVPPQTRVPSPKKTPAPPKTPKAVKPQMASSKKPEIVERAKQNAKKYSADVTLNELEETHQHSEHVAAAQTAAEEKGRLAHEAYHLGDSEALDRENLLGSTEDLMVKGFDGNLSFQRDFLSEGMDMINRFVV